ncbi:MAG: carbon storage regulator CsrA [Desulfobulbaceae bacterium]|nr:carbon storage regulator CsrA [Desulfobulbaceae bacterium]MCK5322683.1 carbon storage regulator CsrA [Desulfobulbaceae bacterium]MCK5544240.1 carbon storage regulator CsrA [Desulfobulbaceae bacterium]
MLILARKAGEAIAINDNIKVKVLEIKGGQVKLGIDAPDHVAIHREEIFLRILEENKRAAMEAPADLSALSSIFGDTSGDQKIKSHNRTTNDDRKTSGESNG